MPPQELRRVSLRFFKDKNPPGDRSQVPAAGASYTVYRQGATVSASATFVSSSTVRVSVVDTGHVRAGDAVQWSQNLGVAFSVALVDPDRKWLDLQSDVVPLTLAVGDRLLPLYFITLYSDPLGTTPLASTVITLDSDGRGSFFCDAITHDGFLAGAGPNQLLLDQPSGLVRQPPWVNVKDYVSFQAAHDALPPEGGTIFVPAGTYSSQSTTAFTNLTLLKPVTLLGEGDEEGVLSRLLVDYYGAKDVDAIHVGVRGGCTIANLTIDWDPSVGAGKGRGIRWYVPGNGAKMAGLTIKNVVIHQSPNLSFEFVCDGDGESYVSKLTMIGCTAYEAKSGGSLFLGGAGTNNNSFERCEFNGPGFGGFHEITDCALALGSSTVFASDLHLVHAGDEVMGVGITYGTAVISVNTGVHPNSMVLSKVALKTTLPGLPETLSFYRASGPGVGQLPRGYVHLLRTSISRFLQCSFQGKNSSPALSTNLISNDLEMRDTYVEKVPDGTGVYSFVIDGMQNMLIDGLFHEVDGYPPPPPTQPPNPDSFLLQTGPLGLSMGRITNAQVVCTQNPLSGTAVVQLANAGDGLIIDHSMEVSNLSGATRDIIVVGTGAILPSILPTVPSGSILKLPNGSDDAFLVSGTTTITDIIEKRPKRRVTLMFADNAVMQVSASLILNGMFAGGADRTISLLCDGTRWIELSRNKTYAERLAATLANNSQTPSVAGNTLFICSNSSSTAITNFMDAEPGQEVTILFTNGNTSIQGGGNFRLVGSFVSAAHATLRLLWDGTSWVELSRSAPQ